MTQAVSVPAGTSGPAACLRFLNKYVGPHDDGSPTPLLRLRPGGSLFARRPPQSPLVHPRLDHFDIVHGYGHGTIDERHSSSHHEHGIALEMGT